MQTAATEVSGTLQQLRGFHSVAEYQAAGEPLPFGLIGVQEELVAPVRPTLIVLSVAVGLVLLIACLNVANLLLARSSARQREMAVRLALGAGRGRLARQLMTESLLLALLGGLAGAWLALGSVTLLRTLRTGLLRRDLGPGVSIPRLAEVSLDWPVFIFVLGVSVASGLLFGAIPAVRQSRTSPISSLRGGQESGASGFNILRRRGHGLLVVTQVALAMVLLIGGTLLMRSFTLLSRVELGFDPQNVLTFQVSYPRGRHRDREAREAFGRDIVARLRVVPGIQSSSYTHFLPLVQSRAGGRLSTRPRGPEPQQPSSEDPHSIEVGTMWVHQDLLGTLGMSIVAGRPFNDGDRAGQPLAIIVNQALMNTGFLGPQPVGQYVYQGQAGPFEIVGVVADFRRFGLNQDAEPLALFDARQRPALPGAAGMSPYIVVKADRNPTALVSRIRSVVAQLDRDAAVVNVATMEQVVANSISRPRLYAVFMGIFAAVAVVLAAVGIYGIVAYSVAARTREIGVRVALGAGSAQVVALVLRQSLLLTSLGITIGFAAAVGLTRYLEAMLFGVTRLDVATFSCAGLTFVAVATLAAFVPARRATAVDPAVALRYE